MNRFEQLIEYVINDEEAKARELFHDIVVAKSREIYENLMQEEAEEDLDEAAEEDLDESEEELDEAEEMDEGAMGGDASDDLIDNVEADESNDMSMEDADFDDEAEEAGHELTHDIEGEHDADEAATKDDIMNLEDKLDQLMAEFEDLMGDKGGDGDDFGHDEGGDAIEMDDTDEMMEAVQLKAAPKPVTTEEGSVNKKGPNANNAGAKGPVGNTVKPVHTGGEGGGKHDAPGAYSNQTKDLIGDFQNKAGAGMKDPKPATKPHLAQATGVNTKSPVARG
jgi:hypothetical protein